MTITYICALVAMAFFTLLERKILGYIQLRKGPNKVSLSGIPQPFADAIKLFVKELNKPSLANSIPFVAAPMLGLFLALIMWTLYPHSASPMFMKWGVLLFLCISSMNVYTTLLSGWASNSKYALIGALRSIAQTISYEVSMALIMLTPLIIMKSLSFNTMLYPAMFMLFIIVWPIMCTWFISCLAETNRTPFDLAEGESELVSGFNTEYSSGTFALIFMAEYMNIIVMSLFTATIFMTWSLNNITMDLILMTTTTFIAILFIWARGAYPRMRYDKLMSLTWKQFLPMSLISLILFTSMAS
uniref:NADH-ubiquinone oxidoreductase chain 1 n=1 Tax=Neanthes glandicincta TaxID=595970 RepID=A0A343J7F8_9ANNE|nr:NADH dehydrogenase subunit 1 [Neanthes glandicincta]ASW20408.1 NADH dehydrogenase subunit 1 [Neanthes glandicincta]